MPKGRQANLSQVVFLPQHKKYTFHRINIEYLVSLKTLNQQSTFRLLESGLRNNMRLQGAEDESCLQSLRPQLEKQAWHIAQQGRNFRHLRQQYANHSKSADFRLHRSNCEVDFANQQLTDSLQPVANKSPIQRVALAEHMLCDALQTNANNYQAHFELGWIYSSLQHQFIKAAFHFEAAAKLAKREHNHDLATIALRHLADIRYTQGDFNSALELSYEVLQDASNDTTDLEYRYELARYLAANDDTRGANQHLEHIVENSPLYYVTAQVEPDFIQHDDITVMLSELHQSRLQKIQHTVKRTWQTNPLSQLQLPDKIQPNTFFQETYERHSRMMEHLPYTVLSEREQAIEELIVHDSAQRLAQVVTKRSKDYESKVETKRSQWSWVNKVGALCLHSAAILFLASVIFFTARFIANAAGMSGLLSADTYVNHVLVALLACLGSGALLVQFVPLGHKERLRKQVELDNSLLLIESQMK